jgi:ATP-binding cassette, subfamily B, bacterial MsbA
MTWFAVASEVVMSQVRRLLTFVRPYSVRFFAAILLMIVVGAGEAVLALLIKPVFDGVLAPHRKTTSQVVLFQWSHGGRTVYLGDFLPHGIHNVWTQVAVALVGVTLIKGLAEYFATYFINYVGQSVVKDLRNQLYSKIIEQSMAFFARHPTGILMSSVTSDIEKVQTAVSQASADSLRETFTLLGLVCVLFYYDWKLALVSLLLVPFVVFPSSSIGRYIRASSRFSQDKMAELNNILQETFSGIRIVKAFGMELFEVTKFRAATRRLLKVNLRWVRANAVSSPLMEVLGAVTIAGLLLYARNAILHDAQTTGSFLGFLYALIKMYEPVKRLTGINNAFQQAVGASEKVFQYLDVHSEIADKPRAITLPPFDREIVFENVDFAYEPGLAVLNGIHLRIGKGEVVALVGPSGAGKTTLANLIPRFFDPTGGSVRMDGHDLRDVKVSSLRAQIGMVTQETILFNDTVFNNIAYGQVAEPRRAVEKAARAAFAHDFIMAMPEGYDTWIGERGQRLSGGQRQRIAIARALLKNPPILILDEATSELDTESELLVQRALQNLMEGRTVLVIAHRLSTVRRADRIVVVDQGSISEVGTHEDLINRGGIYQRLHELQFVDTQP